MSVNIATNTQPSTWLQRLTGTEPSTVIKETSTTTVVNKSGFSLGNALKLGGIGAAVTGALGGVSLLTKISLPLLGKVASVAGLGKLALMGGAVGIAAAALPTVLPKLRENPTARAAAIGAGIGAAAGLVMPFVPMWLGAAVGAGVGLLVHNRRNRPAPGYPAYPGYVASPGWVPYGTNPGAAYPQGFMPVTPNYSPAYASAGMNGMLPYPTGAAGYPGYAPTGYGYGATLPAQAQVAAPVAAPAAVTPVAVKPKPAAGKTPKGKTFTDGAGNLRQVGTGRILRPAAAAAPAAAPMGTNPAMGAMMPSAATGMSALTNPASYVPGMAGALPFQGGSPFSAGSAALGSMMSASPQSLGMGAGTASAGTAPALTGFTPTIAASAIPAMPSAA